MDIIITFNGGPLDGYTMTSDSDDPIERYETQFVAQVIGGCLRDAEKREVTFNPGLMYTVPSKWLMEKAKRENWSDAKVAALVTKHEYKYLRHTETDGIAEIVMQFVRSK